MQAVPATAGCGIIQCNSQIVFSHEPVESGPGLLKPTIFSGRPKSFEASGHSPSGFERLLVKAALLLSATIKTLRPDRNKMGIPQRTLRFAQPIECSQRHGYHRDIGTATACSQNRLRQSGV